jgi:hypothetical protein
VINLRGNLIARAWRLKNFPTIFLRGKFSTKKAQNTLKAEEEISLMLINLERQRIPWPGGYSCFI